MMEDKQVIQMIGILKKIDDKMSVLINLQKASTKLPELGKEEKAILKLCNGKNTIAEIAKESNKTNGNVKVALSRLRKKGIIKSTTIIKKWFM